MDEMTKRRKMESYDRILHECSHNTNMFASSYVRKATLQHKNRLLVEMSMHNNQYVVNKMIECGNASSQIVI